MDRKEFLSMLGFSAASVAVAACLGGCTKESGLGTTSGPSNVDFTLDLSSAANAALKNNGGYVYSNGVIVAKTTSGNYIAVQQTCTHEQFSVVYQGSYNRFFCSRHDSAFSTSGAVTSGPAPRALKQYNTALEGTMLRIYS